MEELVSIIVPCYNHEKYVKSCIQSIINQTYGNIELIICDDCSTDNSYHIIKEYETALQQKFKTYIYRHSENKGVCTTLNEMIRMSSGKFIKSIASDDMLSDQAIEWMVQYAQDHPFDILFTNAYKIGTDDLLPFENYTFPLLYKNPPVYGLNITGQLCSGNYILGASMYFKRETFEKYGLFDETLSYEDWEYCLRVSRSGLIEYCHLPTVFYRVSLGSLSHPSEDADGIRKNRCFYLDKKRIFNKYKSLCSQSDKSAFYSQNLRVAIILNDIQLAHQIVKEADVDGTFIEKSANLRYVLLKLGIYNFTRKIKKKLKGKPNKCK